MAWTKEQELAINLFGQNIIVSAGAGSGKTAVLTERVIKHLKRGIHIHELLILTFTKAAAMEMKERIRNKIKKDEELTQELDTLDEAYITTFDSFSLAMVKKYHYLLNLPKNPKITDEAMIELLREECMKNVFNEMYEEENESFLNFVDTFCVKDDDNLVLELINLAKKLENSNDILLFLDNYESNYYSKDYVDKIFKDYEDLVLEGVLELKEVLEELDYVAPKDYMEKVNNALIYFLNAKSYDELYALKSTSLPMLPRGIDEEVKEAKELVNSKLSKIKDYFLYGSKEEIIDDYYKTRDFNRVIIAILKRYFTKVLKEKKRRGYYDFNDIAHYALEIFKSYPNVLLEVKNSFKEIMVDEYQDTNDLQEEFLTLLGNNNIYMVGDIKQSIYRFRNANPYLFKSKYDAYSKQLDGIKIDLLKNFRSREEVLNNINLLFNPLMDDYIGGANYTHSHQMVFGNTSYLGKNGLDNYQMEIKKYPVLKNYQFSKDEIEIFYIGNDIKKRIEIGEMVFDKDTGELRPITYSDFCILLDRTSSFDDYLKIFNYLEIPLMLYKDETLAKNIHFMTVKNCFLLITKLEKKEFDDDFKFSLVSLARGFLFRMADEDIYKLFKERKWYEFLVVKVLKPILEGINGKSVGEIMDEILDLTNYYQKIITIGDVLDSMVVLDKMKDFAMDAARFGYTYQLFSEFLENILKSDLQVKYQLKQDDVNSVKIMTIHKSKGLEFPICYFSGLYKKFNISDLKDTFFFDKKYGLITPIMKEGLVQIFVKELVENEFLKEEVSEKIRLFYVALTRAREKMIFILPENTKDNVRPVNGMVHNYIRLNYMTFQSILESMTYLLHDYTSLISLESLNLSKDYLYDKEKEKLDLASKKIITNELPLNNTYVDTKKIAKEIDGLLSKSAKKNILLGEEFHKTLEYLDFKEPLFNKIDNQFIRDKIINLWNSKLIQEHLEGEFYQEYEFVMESDKILKHGVIDLLIVLDKEAIIIDYKLDNVMSEAYKLQLTGYKEYILKTLNIPVKTYLYSLLKETFTFVDI